MMQARHKWIAACALALGCALGGSLAVAQNEPAEPAPPDVRGEAAEQEPRGVLTLVTGEQREGAAALRDGKLVVTADGGEREAFELAEIARLEIRPAVDEPDPPAVADSLEGALPSPWRSKDLGRMVVPGRARWNDGQFILSASPRGNGERFEAMHMAYVPMKGDGEIVARVVRIDNEDEDSFGGIIMADGLTPENRKAMLAVHFHGERQVNFRRWGYQGGSSTGKEDPAIKPPFWLKLVREKFDVTAYYSPDGRRWRFLKEDEGKMRDEQIYVGLVARIQRFDRLSEVVIDNVSINGEPHTTSEPMLPHVVLRSGSRLAAEIVAADRTAFRFAGRWTDLAVTTPQVARVEFFHPLPEELAALIRGDRTGLLLRSGDFAEGEFQGLREGNVQLSSLLFGEREYSILDHADALVLRPVAPPAREPDLTVTTHAGSVLLARQAALDGDKLSLEAEGLGKLALPLEEIAALVRPGAP